MVSNKIADGDFKTLDGLVTGEIVPSLQKSISIMSLPQREQLAINMEDIYFSFPYQVQVTLQIRSRANCYTSNLILRLVLCSKMKITRGSRDL